MAERVFFSVLVPVYNVAPWLRDCLDSIPDQGWERLDVVLVDDGSTDESGAICDEYAAKDSRVRVFHKSNGGLMSARRYGIERAEGDWYLFVDSDDKLLPGVFEALDRAIRESGADCVLYGIRMETPKTEWHILNPAALCNRLITDKREILRQMIVDDSYNSLCRKCVRASCFDGRDFSPWFHISRGEDLIQSTEILENARSFYLLPEEYYLYRFNRASITRSIRFDGYRADFTLERFFRDWLKSPGRAVISVVHDLSMARAYGTHAVLLDKGRTAAAGKVEDVFQPEHLDPVYGMDVSEWMKGLLSVWEKA